MPTLKQKKAFKAALENGGVVSRAMAEAGYSDSMAKNPQKLTTTPGWKELMDTHLPEDHLAERHRELLDSPKGETANKALDMAYKLKGSYAPDKSININAELTVDEGALDKLTNILNGIHKGASQSGDGTPADALDNKI